MKPRDKPRTSYLIGRLERMVYRDLDEMLRPEGISVLAYTALTVLATRPGLSNAQLARRSFLSPQGMNQALTGMVERGLVRRTPDERNRKVLRIELTDEGRRLVETYERRIGRYEEKLLASLSEEQRGELNAMLRSVVEDGYTP